VKSNGWQLPTAILATANLMAAAGSGQYYGINSRETIGLDEVP
jgi:hypothetical protein